MAVTLDDYKTVCCTHCGYTFTYYNRKEGDFAKYVRIALATFQQHRQDKFPTICPHCGYDVE